MFMSFRLSFKIKRFVDSGLVLFDHTLYVLKHSIAQSAGAVEYTAEGSDPPPQLVSWI